jgi:hypothetical protein
MPPSTRRTDLPQTGSASVARDKAESPLRGLSAAPFGASDGFAALGLAILIGIVGFILLNRPLKDDVAWLLYLADQMLEGRKLYVDLIEINPPLIVLLSTLPVAFARAVGLPQIPVFLATVAVAVLACAWCTAELLRNYSALFRRRFRTFVVIATVLFLLPGVEFGQREHLLIAFILPYLALLALRLQGVATLPAPAAALAVGILAGIGFALKPYHLLAFAMLEALALARRLRPWRRGEAIGAVLFLLGYALSIQLFFPAYLERIVPLTRDLYGASNVPVPLLLFKARYLFASLAAVFLLVRADVGRISRQPLVWVLAAVATNGLIAYLVQQKSWFYHRIPGETAATLLFAYWAAEIIRAEHQRLVRAAQVSLATVAVLLGALSAAMIDRQGRNLLDALSPQSTLEYRVAELIRRTGATSLMVFSQALTPAFPVVNVTGVRWTSRFDTMWALRGDKWRRTCCGGADGGGAAAWPVRRWIVDDFLAGRPDLVVVDDRQNLDSIGELSVDSRFRAVWSSYRLVDAFPGYRVFLAER